jgi:small GTP-binding protein
MEGREISIILLGDSGVGKTRMVSRYVEHQSAASVAPTIGVACRTAVVQVDGTDFSLKIWDTAGQEIYRSLSEMYYRNGQGILLVFDQTRPETFTSLSGWFESIQNHAMEGTPVVICANKTDLPAKIEADDAVTFAQSKKSPLVLTSAQNGEGIEDAFTTVAALAQEHLAKVGLERDQSISLSNRPVKRKSGCCG